MDRLADIEAELGRLHRRIQKYGSFQAAPDALLDECARLWDRWNGAKLREEQDGAASLS